MRKLSGWLKRLLTIFKEVWYGTAVGVESSLKRKKAEVQVQKVVD